MPLEVVAQLRHSYGSCSIIVCIPMGSCRDGELCCMTIVAKIRFEPPTQSVTHISYNIGKSYVSDSV